MTVTTTKNNSKYPLVDNALNTLFPRDQYGKNKEVTFHYIVNHAKDTSLTLKKWGDTVTKKYPPSFYHQPEPQMGLTPLHVAAMKGDQAAVEFFLDRGCRLDVQDERKWTPLHHAAARNDLAMLEFMKSIGDFSLIKNAWGSTPQDFLDLQNPPEIAEDAVVCQYQEGDTVQDCTARMFREYTGANYTSQVIATTEGLYSAWLRTQKIPVPLTREIEKTYVFPHLSEPRPQLTLRRTENLGFEITTTTIISEGTILGEYTGQLVPDRQNYMPERDTSYLMEEVDGREWRNLMAILNDGPPNATVCPILNHAGLPERVMLIALRTIQPEVAITFDYGASHKIKWGFYQMSNQQKDEIMRRWEYWLEHHELQTNGSLLQCQQYKADCFYILSTPEALLHLILNNSSNGLEHILKTSGESNFGLRAFDVEISCQLLKSGRIFAETLESLNPTSKKIWTDFSIRLIHRYERIFAHIVLSAITPIASQFSHETDIIPFSFELDEAIRKEMDKLISKECQDLIQTRRSLASSGVSLGDYPVDLETVIQRIEKSME